MPCSITKQSTTFYVLTVLEHSQHALFSDNARLAKWEMTDTIGVFFWDFETFGILKFADIEAFENVNPKEYKF